MITAVDEYFAKGCGRCERFATKDCSTQQWKRGLAELRQICLREEVAETVKWGHPCFVRNSRNIAIIGAFRSDFRLSFFDAALMKDPASVLERQGPNTRYPDAIRFTSVDRVLELEPTIRAYIRECIEYADAGVKPPKTQEVLELPVELIEALNADLELAEAFEKLTPGRKKSYVLNLSHAKKSATRVARIAKFKAKIISGKGATER